MLQWEAIVGHINSDTLYMEPKFSSGNLLGEKALQRDQGGTLLYPYFVEPTTMTQLRSWSSYPDVAVVINSLHTELDLQDPLWNLRQQPLLANKYIVKFGLGEEELAYAKKMLSSKFKWFLIESRHGARQEMIDQVVAFRMLSPEAILIVGNMYNLESIDAFAKALNEIGAYRVDYWQVAVDTKNETFSNRGLGSLAEIREAGYPVIATMQNSSARAIFITLASGAKWIKFSPLSLDGLVPSYYNDIQEELLKMLDCSGSKSLEEIYEQVELKSRG